MKKSLLFILIIVVGFIMSCSKSKNNDSAQANSFVPVKIYVDNGACPCCGYGYLVLRQDSIINYNTDTLPTSPFISIPATVKIKFHKTGPGCIGDKIIIDEIAQ